MFPVQRCRVLQLTRFVAVMAALLFNSPIYAVRETLPRYCKLLLLLLLLLLPPLRHVSPRALFLRCCAGQLDANKFSFTFRRLVVLNLLLLLLLLLLTKTLIMYVIIYIMTASAAGCHGIK